MESRFDFKRFNNGCYKLHNMVVTTQGPVTRRPGTEFVADMADLDQDPNKLEVRFTPFIFNELQSYMLVWFYTSVGPTVAFLFDQAFTTTDSPAFVDEQPYTSYQFPVSFTGAGLGQHPLDDYVVSLRDNTGALFAISPSQYFLEQFNATDVAITLLNDTYDSFVDSMQLEVIDAVQIPYTVALPTGFDIAAFDWAQSADVLFIAQPNLAPQLLARSDHIDWNISTQPVIDPGNDGDPDVWDDMKGWPRTVTFHQQRLIYAGTKTYRQKVWCSEAGNFDNFKIIPDDPLSTAAPIAFQMDSGTQNQIQWLTSLKTLNVGTLGDEWTVTGTNRDALVPGGVTTKRQTNLGSERINPLIIGITLLFLERFGKTINEFVYDFNTDSYKTSDVSILSKHLTEIQKITDWAYQQVPDSIVWAIRDDGALLGVTYQRQHEIIGWHVHTTPGYTDPILGFQYSQFTAVGAIPGSLREDEVYLAASRSNGLKRSVYIERLSGKFRGTQASDGHFLDNHVHRSLPAGTAGLYLFTGLTNFANMTIGVIADGKYLGETFVDNDGETLMTLNGERNFLFGIEYVSEVWPTVKDEATKEGSMSGKMQRITNLAIDLYNSSSFTCGRWSRETGEVEEAVDLTQDRDDPSLQIPLYSGIYHYEFPEGFDRESNYFIRQSKPYPLTIRSVTDTVEVTR